MATRESELKMTRLGTGTPTGILYAGRCTRPELKALKIN